MFLPFIPHLLALAGVAGLLGFGDVLRVQEVAGWELWLVYAVLPLLGGLVGQLPERWLGGYRPGSLNRRRVVLLATWLWVVAEAALPQALAARLKGSGAGEEAAILLLLVNFWLSDALALAPYNPLLYRYWREQRHRLGQALRLPAPIVVLMALGLALPVLSDRGPLGWLSRAPGLAWLDPLGMLGLMLLLAGVAVPYLIRVCWGLRPLAVPEAERVVREELAANRVSVSRVLAWPEEMMGSATAGVIGLLPGFRYLLFSNALARSLTAEEIRSVTAHEAAHLKYRHLWYFLAAIIAFVALMQALMTALFWAGLLTDHPVPAWLYVGIEVAALLLFLRVGFGYLSRAFERQADGHALRRLGLLPFHSAITKVGLLNGIPAELDNWHHFGIGRRVSFLRRATESAETLPRHDRKVRRIKLALLALLALSLAAQAGLSSQDAVAYLSEHYLAQRVAQLQNPGPGDLHALNLLAARALQRNDLADAKRYFRLILRVTPEDPQVQNNLAWVLVTQPKPRRHDLAEGLRLAKEAVHASQSAYIWDTVAEAYYRLNEFDKAATAADRALQLAKAGEGRGEATLEYYQQRLQSFKQHVRGA